MSLSRKTHKFAPIVLSSKLIYNMIRSYSPLEIPYAKRRPLWLATPIPASEQKMYRNLLPYHFATDPGNPSPF